VTEHHRWIIPSAASGDTIAASDRPFIDAAITSRSDTERPGAVWDQRLVVRLAVYVGLALTSAAGWTVAAWLVAFVYAGFVG
jgi:hypothetical protein